MISPVIFRVGNFQITYYALVYIGGFITALFFLLHYKKELKLKEEQCYTLIVLNILGVIIGARIFHILFWNLNYFMANPIKVFYIWQGGFSFHGGILGAVIVSALYAKLNKISFAKLADVLILPAMLFLALGRIANFINQEIVGKATTFPLCVNFEYYQDCRHPVQLYASAGRFALFGFLLYLKKLKMFKPGFIFWVGVFLLGLGRFILDFIREDALYFYLSAGQWFSLLMVLIGSFVLVKYYKKELY